LLSVQTQRQPSVVLALETAKEQVDKTEQVKFDAIAFLSGATKLMKAGIHEYSMNMQLFCVNILYCAQINPNT